MIIWRGLGFLGLVVALGIPLGAGIWSATGLSDRFLPAFVGLGMIAGAVATYAIGLRLNVRGPAQRVARWEAQRRAELYGYVDAGTFHLGPGHPAPQSHLDARQQAEALLATERARVGRTNVHTFFFIPLQHFAFVGAGIGLVLIVVGIVRGVAG